MDNTDGINKVNRSTLRGFFKKGCIPREEDFAALIDSVPNIVEDGQVIRTKEGWAFYSQNGEELQVTLHEAEGQPAVWTLAVTSDKGLAMKNRNGDVLLEMTQDKTIVLHAAVQKGGEAPEPAMPDYSEIKADKQWADLAEVTDGKEGSRVYSVIALYRDANLGVCKLTRATAICLNSLEQRVESPRKHWWGWSGHIRLRWLSEGGKVRLQIRSTRNSYSGKIYCRVTETFKK